MECEEHLTSASSKKKSNLACVRCRKRHVKCPGGEPCRNCLAAKHECEYVEADKKIVISMKYLNKLHEEIRTLKVENASLRSKKPSSLTQEPFAIPSNHSKKPAHEAEFIPPFLDKYGRLMQSPTGQKIFVGSSSMSLFGLEVGNMMHPKDDASSVLEREGNAYRIMLGKSKKGAGITVNFTLPSYSYAMLLVDNFISYNDGCFYLFNEGTVKENLKRIYNDEPLLRQSGTVDPICDTIFYCKALLIFATGEMYVGTANQPSGNKKKENAPELPGSAFFHQASELFAGLFSSGAIENACKEGGIEVLLLFAFYLQVADCTLASYFYFGIALRASLTLGMHVDAGKENINRFELEHRRRLWWTVYIFERMLAAKMGLPLSLSEEDIASALPEDFDMSHPPVNCEYFIFPEAEFIKNCVKITHVNAHILSKLYNRPPDSNILPTVNELVLSLLQWKKNLPPYIDCNYSEPEIKITRLVVNLMTEYFHGLNLAVRPLLFHFVSKQAQSSPSTPSYFDLSQSSPLILTLLNTSFHASINTVRSLWALMPQNMLALFGYMDREYLFTSAATLILFNAAFGVYHSTTEHIDHALTMFTKMRNLGNHPAALRRAQLLKLMKLLDFQGAMDQLLKKHNDSVNTPFPKFNDQTVQTYPSGGADESNEQPHKKRATNNDTVMLYFGGAGDTVGYTSSYKVQAMNEALAEGEPLPLTDEFKDSPSLKPLGDDKLFDKLENFQNLLAHPENQEEMAMWDEITSNGVWLAADVNEEFKELDHAFFK